MNIPVVSNGCFSRTFAARFMRPSAIGIAFLVIAYLGATEVSAEMRVETGIDVFRAPRSDIEALHRFSVFGGSEPLSYGQSIYSAAVGDAGGAFFWGYEAALRVPLERQLSAYAGVFAGGGGGAAQVIGDGFMVRGALGVEVQLSERLGLSLGGSWISVDGAAIDDAAYALGLSARKPGEDHEVPEPTAVGAEVAIVQMGAGETRSGTVQPDLLLVGAQARYGVGQNLEASFATAGAAVGAEGYMQVMAGLRKGVPFGPAVGFAEASFGFAGGGEVDTGGGAVASLGFGVAVPLSARQSLEVGVAWVATAGAASGTAATVRLMRHFDQRVPDQPQDWRVSTGVSFYAPLSEQSDDKRPFMHEVGVDLYIGERAYLAGTASTALGGGVAGFAIGLFGLGWDIPLSAEWALALEGQVGAAGGGGVDVAGGAVAGLRLEIDRKLRRGMTASLGVGGLSALTGGGLSSSVVQIGLKVPFTTR